MRNFSNLFVLGLLVLPSFVMAGCGGGATTNGQASLNQPSTRGTVAVNLKFAAAPAGRAANRPAARGRGTSPGLPPYAGNIPFGASSVRITVVNPTTGAELAPARVVTHPATNNQLAPLVTVQYAALPVGPIRVNVSAFPSQDGSGNSIADGSAAGQIAPLDTTNLTVPMTLTVTKLIVNPTSISLNPDANSATITASALNASNQPLVLPLMYISADPDIANVFSLSSDGTLASVSEGGTRGLTEVTVYEPNSGLSAIVKVESQ